MKHYIYLILLIVSIIVITGGCQTSKTAALSTEVRDTSSQTVIKINVAKQQIKTLHDTVRLFYLDTGVYPQHLDDLVQEPTYVQGWNLDGYLNGATEIPLDPWGNEYEYRYPGMTYVYEIISFGADGFEGGTQFNQDIYNSDYVKKRGKTSNNVK